jgi:cbb3-type cytochrome oxidase maturation protein
VIEYLTLGEFAVALLMSLAALCAFVWGAATGAFRDVEAVKHQVLRVEGVEHYAQGEIRVDYGIVNTWLLVVYAVLAVWGVYYLVKFWGGLGPGLGVGQ